MDKLMAEKQELVDGMTVNDLIACFEIISFMGGNVEYVSKDIYAKLIDMGYTPSNLLDEHEVADMLLVDFKFEFENEDILAFAVFHIIRLAKADR